MHRLIAAGTLTIDGGSRNASPFPLRLGLRGSYRAWSRPLPAPGSVGLEAGDHALCALVNDLRIRFRT